MAVQFIFLFYSSYKMCFPVWWVCLQGGRCARRRQAAGSCWHANYLRTQYWLKVKSGGGGGVVRRAADTRDTQRSPPPRSQQLAGQQPAASRGDTGPAVNNIIVLSCWLLFAGPGQGRVCEGGYGAGRGRPGTGSVRYSGQWSVVPRNGTRGQGHQWTVTRHTDAAQTDDQGAGHRVTNDIHLWVLFLLCQAASSTPLSSPHSVDISDNTLAKWSSVDHAWVTLTWCQNKMEIVNSLKKIMNFVTKRDRFISMDDIINDAQYCS